MKNVTLTGRQGPAWFHSLSLSLSTLHSAWRFARPAIFAILRDLLRTAVLLPTGRFAAASPSAFAAALRAALVFVLALPRDATRCSTLRRRCWPWRRRSRPRRRGTRRQRLWRQHITEEFRALTLKMCCGRCELCVICQIHNIEIVVGDEHLIHCVVVKLEERSCGPVRDTTNLVRREPHHEAPRFVAHRVAHPVPFGLWRRDDTVASVATIQ